MPAGRRALSREDLFTVVFDQSMTDTAQFADVLLPVTQWAEEEGTMTNLEGRVIRRRRLCQQVISSASFSSVSLPTCGGKRSWTAEPSLRSRMGGNRCLHFLQTAGR